MGGHICCWYSGMIATVVFGRELSREVRAMISLNITYETYETDFEMCLTVYLFNLTQIEEIKRL